MVGLNGVSFGICILETSTKICWMRPAQALISCFVHHVEIRLGTRMGQYQEIDIDKKFAGIMRTAEIDAISRLMA